MIDEELLKENFKKCFCEDAEFIISAPGRTEIGGNHTDHQHGKVFASAIKLRTFAAVKKRKDDLVNIVSSGFEPMQFFLTDLEKREKEEGTSLALAKGMAYGFSKKEGTLCGFDAYIESEVPVGSGLSSSASFEVLIGRIFNNLGEYDASPEEIAEIAQRAENLFYGKPCGLMDQMVCSKEGLIEIDFRNPERLIINEIGADFAKHGYSICIVRTNATHENLTREYAAIINDLKAICNFFDKEYLREVIEQEFYNNISSLREEFGDRAVLRAIHVFEENKRVEREVDALQKEDYEEFLSVVTESGHSSFEYLQNVVPSGNPYKQEMAIALALCQKALKGKGAFRIHGGGFGGSIQAFVPIKDLSAFKVVMDSYFGKGACIEL